MTWHYVVILAPLLAFAQLPAGQDCLHGQRSTSPTVGADARLGTAVMVARTINTAEAKFHNANRRYANQAELARMLNLDYSDSPNLQSSPVAQTRLASVAPGWALSVVVEGTGYWFVIRDTLDPCGFAVFGTESGIISRTVGMS